MFLGSAETPKYTKYGAVNPPGSDFDKTCPSELRPHLQQQMVCPAWHLFEQWLQEE